VSTVPGTRPFTRGPGAGIRTRQLVRCWWPRRICDRRAQVASAPAAPCCSEAAPGPSVQAGGFASISRLSWRGNQDHGAPPVDVGVACGRPPSRRAPRKMRSGAGVRKAIQWFAGLQGSSGGPQPQPPCRFQSGAHGFLETIPRSSGRWPIASPPTFIEVLSTAGDPRISRKAKRGILVTT